MKLKIVLLSLLFCGFSQAQIEENQNNFVLPAYINNDTNNSQIEALIEQGKVAYFSYGYAFITNEKHKKFKEKYGISFYGAGCMLQDIGLANNQRIFKYLNEKYGVTWTKDFPYKLNSDL